MSETLFGDREHTIDRWVGGSCRVSRPREEGQLERCARAVEGLRVKLNQKQIQSRYISSGLCAWMLVCVLPQIAFVGSILDVVTDVVVHSMSCCAVSSIKNLQFEPKIVFLVFLLASCKYHPFQVQHTV